MTHNELYFITYADTKQRSQIKKITSYWARYPVLIPEQLTIVPGAPSHCMTHNSAPYPSHVSNHFPAVAYSLLYELCFLPSARHHRAGGRAGEYFTMKPRVMPSLDVHSRTNYNGEVLWWRPTLLWVPAWSTNVDICSPCLLAKPEYSMQLITPNKMRQEPILYPLQESWPPGLYKIQSKACHSAKNILRCFENETFANNSL